MRNSTEVLHDAMELEPAQRAALAQRLLESLELEPDAQAEIDEGWTQEIECRIAAYERGEVQGVEASEVFERAFKSLRRGKP